MVSFLQAQNKEQREDVATEVMLYEHKYKTSCPSSFYTWLCVLLLFLVDSVLL